MHVLKKLCWMAIAWLPLAASASLIAVTATQVAGTHWIYDYKLSAGAAAIDEFTLYFDAARYANLAVAATPAGWDGLTVQADLALAADGFFDALALGTGLGAGMSLGGFQVAFDFIGAGVPATQRFDIVDPVTFEVLETGMTLLVEVPPQGVPEPGVWLLLIAGLAALLASRKGPAGRTARVGAALGLTAFLSSCGSDTAAPQAHGNVLAATAAAQDVSVTGIAKASETRIGRTIYEYTFRVTLANGSANDQVDVKATLASAGQGTTIVDGTVEVASLGKGASVTPPDTIVLRHDRSYGFDLQALVWKISATPVIVPPPSTGFLNGNPNDQAIDHVEAFRSAEVYPNSSYELDTATGDSVLRALVQIAFKPGATVGQVNALLTQIHGRIVVAHANTALLFVRIPDPGSIVSLEQVVANIEQSTFVEFANITRSHRAESVPDMPFKTAESLSNIANHLAAHGHLAWNARGAIGFGGAALRPAIVLEDDFGDGAPLGFIDNLSFARATDYGFSSNQLQLHGYHVMGILGATYDDALDVTGAYPGMVPGEALKTEVIDRLFRAGRSDEERLADAIKFQIRSGRNVVASTSFGNSVSGGLGPIPLFKEERIWLMLVRGGFGLLPNPAIEDHFFHSTSAGNNHAMLARTNTGYAGVAVDGLLQNTVAVENRVNSLAVPFDALCLYSAGLGATAGGSISAFGTNVWSFVNAAGKGERHSGSSMATPQVAGFAAYLWAINPALKSSEVRDAIVSNARAREGCGDGGANYLDAYAAVLAADDASALAAAGQARRAPARLAILDLNGDGMFKDDDVLLFLDAYAYLGANGSSAFDASKRFNRMDPSRFDLNGDATVAGPGKAAFNLDISYSAGKKHGFNVAYYEAGPQIKVQLDENGVTDLQILCYYTYSKLFTGDIAKVEQALQSKQLSCRGPLIGVELRVNDTHPAWNGLPATILLSNFHTPSSIARFSIDGNSPTCGNQFPWLAGERGGPIFSSQVEPGSLFQGAYDVTGMPSSTGGPSVNYRNCSSFFAYKTVQDPSTQKLYAKVWVNATGRAVQFRGVTFDWEYQIRYFSGDPLNNYAGRYAKVGVVPNSGNFALSFNAISFTLSYVYGPAVQ